MVAAFYGMFQHWNVRTPQWMGYLIQREEHGSVFGLYGVTYKAHFNRFKATLLANLRSWQDGYESQRP